MKQLSRRNLVFFLAAGAGLVGCKPVPLSQKNVSVVCDFSPAPPREGLATVTIRLADAKGQWISGARLAIEGDMTHPGMSPVFGRAVEIAPGQYQGQLNFTMPGDWAVLIRGTTPGGQTVERQIDLRSVRPR